MKWQKVSPQEPSTTSKETDGTLSYKDDLEVIDLVDSEEDKKPAARVNLVLDFLDGQSDNSDDDPL